jgi:hypothetical protein
MINSLHKAAPLCELGVPSSSCPCNFHSRLRSRQINEGRLSLLYLVIFPVKWQTQRFKIQSFLFKSQLYLNSGVHMQVLAPFCFHFDGRVSGQLLWNNIHEPGSPSVHLLPSACSRRISLTCNFSNPTMSVDLGDTLGGHRPHYGYPNHPFLRQHFSFLSNSMFPALGS